MKIIEQKPNLRIKDNGMFDTGYNAPTGLGTTNEWTNPVNAYLEDGVFATAGASVLSQDYINFGLSIPSNSVISGIQVKVKASAPGPKNISVQLNNRSSVKGNGLSPSLLFRNYGSSSDLWGTTWQASDFSNDNFILTIKSSSHVFTASVDYIIVRVFYTFNDISRPNMQIINTIPNLKII